MLKITLAMILILFLAVYFYRSPEKIEQTKQDLVENLTPSPFPENTIQIDYAGRTYRLLYERINGKNITLIPNFSAKRSATALTEENNCTAASSGGFYTKDDKPLGLFKTEGRTITQQINNSSLLTGFFYVSAEGDPYITDEVPLDAPLVVQSGPLFETAQVYPTKTDEYTRRNLVIEDTQGSEYIATIFGNENTFDGPQLSDIPPILFSITSPFQVQRVLNLDGGSASFFKSSSGFTVSELIFVGSIICIN